jgi:hypothetical protein
MLENNPITDAELAEVKRRHAAATPGKLRAVGYRLSHEANREIHQTVFHLDEIGQIGTGPYQAIPFARREDAEWHAALHNAFPGLLARLEAADIELQGWRHERAMTLTAFAHVRDGGDAALIGHPNGSVFGDALRDMIAARDAQQRREGVLEGLNMAGIILSANDDPEVAIKQAAKRLRKTLDIRTTERDCLQETVDRWLDRAEAAERERDEALVLVGELRGKLEEMRPAVIENCHQSEYCSCSECEGNRLAAEIDDALATTAPQALGRLKAGVLREVCKDRVSGGLCQRVAVDYLEWTNKEPLASQLHTRPMMRLSVLDADEVMREADRLEAENGTR